MVVVIVSRRVMKNPWGRNGFEQPYSQILQKSLSNYLDITPLTRLSPGINPIQHRKPFSTGAAQNASGIGYGLRKLPTQSTKNGRGHPCICLDELVDDILPTRSWLHLFKPLQRLNIQTRGIHQEVASLSAKHRNH